MNGDPYLSKIRIAHPTSTASSLADSSLVDGEDDGGE